ncbi:hypothetical protein D1872_90050 [compost metagenome]
MTKPIRGIYLWEAERVNDLNVVDKCVWSYVTEIYVTFKVSKAPPDQYARFIEHATSLGIQVHALFGDAMWALPNHKWRGTDAITSVANYNDSVTPEQRFAGVHFDVEPHGLNGKNGYPDLWNTDRVGTIKSWIDNSRAWVNVSRSYGLPLNAAILSFLDNTDNYPVPPEYAHLGENVNNILTDLYDGITLMSYRDTAEGVYNISATKLDYPQTPKITIALECTAQTPDYITFYEEGFLIMDETMMDIHDMMEDKPGYRGLAIHAYRQWEKFIDPYFPAEPKE